MLDYFVVTFTDLVISNYEVGSPPPPLVADPELQAQYADVLPEEHIEFNFSKIEKEYFVQAKDGTVSSAGKHGWHLKEAIKT